MRIIGGKHRRRRFDIPKSFNARPTTDFAKENLFNVLANLIDLEGITALDLFSGTGGITAELLSRGASHVVAVEQRSQHVAFIRSLIEQIREQEQATVLQADVFRYLRQAREGRPLPTFDLVFADPPYKLEEIADLPDLILSSGRLKSDALVVVEHPDTYDFSQHPHFFQHREYGSVNFSFFSATVESGER